MLIAAGLAAGMSAKAQTGIEGSKHDFSGATWNSTGNICLPCHTPHSGTGTMAPLWNHGTTTNSFTLYSSDTLDATDMGQPGSESLACLSCHDGTVALDSFGGNGITNNTYMSGTALVGTDLGNDHPVSFTYDDTLAGKDGSLHTPSDTASGIGTKTIAEAMLFGGKMECASCHDVHNSTGLDGLLLKDNSGSALCLTCHDK